MPQSLNPFSRAAPSQDPREGHTYIPPNIEKAMAEESAKESPSNVVVPDQANEVPAQNQAPTASGPAPQTPTASQETPATPEPASPDQPYSFITDPELPPKRPLMESLPGGGSLPIRIGLAAGALLVLLVIFVIFKGLVSGGNGNTALLMTVAQDQQEMIHLAMNTAQQQGLSTNNTDFAATLQITMSSSQGRLISYMQTQHQKVNPKQLNLKVSTTTDEQLAASSTAGTYNQTFAEIMKAKLDAYGSDIQKAYTQDKGKNARALLADDYHQAQLLAVQLKSPDN